ncbi:hypothetical protein NAK90_005737 [Salmonella enterica]|uniref:Uncharacterized protein n=1 Tax=Salmonella enterica TaxID=28901 RepID=A0A750HRY3_SALER|nr:hypothetical protein [Salmonella enterica subsp. enterica serovar Panama]ECF2799478.1 hypothetical protein [Salmonella enterica subsp. enterica serovar Miami]EDO3656268.1 hypothetical protein [Salmonella enterica]EDW0700981.1 hypothetical protein [Salmonella enterica subsp. enterica]EEE1025932.1 hypothetical protein [Salmonella enterica subsp. enterica serovar Miami]
MKNNTIEIYRRRIAVSALNRVKRKTGAYRLTVSMPDGDIQFIDIDEESMQKLLQRFEKQVRAEFGSESESFLQKTYMNSLDINGHTEYLTETGEAIVDDIFSELIAYAKEKFVCGGIN